MFKIQLHIPAIVGTDQVANLVMTKINKYKLSKHASRVQVLNYQNSQILA